MAHALTIDLEDWRDTEAVRAHRRSPAFPPRIEVSTHILLELLARRGARATFFTLGKVAVTHPGLVRSIVAAGHTLGSHGFSHRPVGALGPQGLRAELRRTKAALEDVTGRAVTAHRCPSWSVGARTLWALPVIAACGFSVDASLSPAGTPGTGVRGVPRVPHVVQLPDGQILHEFPLGVTGGWPRLPYAGGFFLRALPPPVVRAAIRRCEHAGTPAVVYAHPWEFDPDSPRVRLPFPWRVLQYHGLRRMTPRFEALLRTFRFAPLEEVCQAYDWSRAPVWRSPGAEPGTRAHRRHTSQ